MTVSISRPRTFESALKKLELLAAEQDVVFRGQTDAAYRLSTTLERYWGGPIASSAVGCDLERFLSQYKSGLVRTGHGPLDAGASTVDWLEHARHHGVPSPLLDFSWSPYVAMFFAFDGVRGEGRCAVYALNTQRLARHWALTQTEDRGPGFRDTQRSFENLSVLGPDELRFVRRPGPYVERMHRQLGAFVYCTLGHEVTTGGALEGYLEAVDEEADSEISPCLLPSNGPVATKVVLRHEWATQVFERLELMNIRGATLLPGADGVAKDVWNGFHYLQKVGHVREPS